LVVPVEWVPGMIDRLPADIEPYEVQQVLNSDRRRPVPVYSKAGARLLLVFGRTRAGRLLAVALRPGPDRHSSIIGAREATANEALEQERWEAGRDG
jgi:hypothetical protein